MARARVPAPPNLSGCGRGHPRPAAAPLWGVARRRWRWGRGDGRCPGRWVGRVRGCLRRPRTPNAHLPRRQFLFTARCRCRSDSWGAALMSYLFGKHGNVGTGREVEAKGFPCSVLGLKSFRCRSLKTLSFLHRLAFAACPESAACVCGGVFPACPLLVADVGCRLPPCPAAARAPQPRAPTPGWAFLPLALFQDCSRHLRTHAPHINFRINSTVSMKILPGIVIELH